MDKKTIRVILAVLLVFFVSCFVIFFALELQIANLFFSLKYDDEIAVLKKYIAVLSTGDEIRVRSISSSDSILLRRDVVGEFAEMFRKVNIDSLRVRGIDRKTEQKKTVLFMAVYFENNPDLDLIMKLINES